MSSGTAIAGCVSFSWIDDVVGQRREVAVLRLVAAQQVLQRGGREEVFLPQPQLVPGRRFRRTGRGRARSPRAARGRRARRRGRRG